MIRLFIFTDRTLKILVLIRWSSEITKDDCKLSVIRAFGCMIFKILKSVTLHAPYKGDSKKMRRLAMALTLAFALSNTALAGEIHTTGIVAPPQDSSVLTVILTILSVVS